MSWLSALRRPTALPELPASVLSEVLARPVFAGLSADAQARLVQRMREFLAGKHFSAAAGLEIDAQLQLLVAAHAALLTLEQPCPGYADWREIILYPHEFVPHREFVDEAGVVHESRYPMLGEAWAGGPLILSAEEVRAAGWRDGLNVPLHEFAHKLDMENGEANGLPALPEGMRVRDWARVWGEAYADFCARLDAGEEGFIDPYAAESPAEFFAVLTEVFFEDPHGLRACYPGVYAAMTGFYRQDPAARLSDLAGEAPAGVD
jgi:Mlc titration factor MtfA (ptsG expression regulator)